MVTLTPPSVRSTPSKGVPTLNAMPRLRNARSSALELCDLAGFRQPLQALVELGHDTVFVGVDGLHVYAAEARLDAELLGLTGGVGHLTGVQERLGRDAAAVQAGAAELVFFDQRDRQAELRGAERGRVAPAPAAEDN